MPLRDISLPPAIEDKLARYAQAHKMRRSKGEYPIVRFAGRLLGILWHNRGSARIHTEDLTAMVGNVHQQNDYKQAMRRLGLVRDWTGSYRVGAASALYRLTEEASSPPSLFCGVNFLGSGEAGESILRILSLVVY